MSGKIRKRPSPPEFVMRQVEDVPLSYFNDQGAVVKENFTIQFKSFTEFGAMRLMTELADSVFNGVLPYSALFEKTIIAIIDSDGEALTDETGAPAVLTREFFAGMAEGDLGAIKAAIDADANPPTTSPTSGPSGSSPAGSEA